MLYRYLAVWAAGIVLMTLWSLLFGRVPIESVPREELFRHVRTQLIRSDVLQSDLVTWWSLLVAVLLSRQWVRSSIAAPAKSPDTGTTTTPRRPARAATTRQFDSSRHFDYLLLWIVGAVVVINWGLWFLEKITPFDFGPREQSTSSIRNFEDGTIGAAAGSALDTSFGAVSSLDLPVTLALVAGWTGLVILLLLFLGDGVKRGFYETALAPYKAVLMTLTVVITLTVLANVIAYVGIQARVGSFEAPVHLLRTTVRELSVNADNIYDSATNLQEDVAIARRALDDESREPAPGEPGASTIATRDRAVSNTSPTPAVPPTLSPVSVTQELLASQRVKQPGELADQGAVIVQLAQRTYDLAVAAVNQLETAQAMELAALEPTAANAVTRQLVTSTATTAPVGTEASETPPNAPADATRAEAELPPVEAVLRDAQVSANQLDAAANVLEYYDLPFLRDSDDATVIPRQLEYDLAEIASHSRAIYLRAEAASQALGGLESRGTSILLWLAAFYAAFVLLPWVLLLMFFYRKRRFRAIEIFDDLKRLDPSETLLRRALGTSWKPGKLSSPDVDDLLERAFSNREYVLSVTLLTVLTAAGWYYFLYPRADIGISALVRSDAGITQLTADLARHASPLTMGFAGAYFFVTQMLLRRYLAGDLYPSAFLQASVRIIWVFTLSVALTVLLPELNIPGLGVTAPIEIEPQYIAMIAFVAGIFPREGFRFIFSAVSQAMNRLLPRNSRNKGFPADTDSAPLTELEGINIWVETRFLEENVENVQGMATAPIERLVVGTYYPASRIVDWVDQAILMTHCGVDHIWYPSLRRAGIRTATDLLDAASPACPGRRNLDTASFDPVGGPLKELAKALAAAATAYKVDTPNPTANILAEMCKVIWPDPNLRYIQRYRESVDEETAAMAPPEPDGSTEETRTSAASPPKIKKPTQKAAGNGHAASSDALPSPVLGGKRTEAHGQV